MSPGKKSRLAVVQAFNVPLRAQSVYAVAHCTSPIPGSTQLEDAPHRVEAFLCRIRVVSLCEAGDLLKMRNHPSTPGFHRRDAQQPVPLHLMALKPSYAVVERDCRDARRRARLCSRAPGHLLVYSRMKAHHHSFTR
ncbi:hypothetical protein QQF64_027045 [Cirrhinus molitorella]|uniref:Uncharacterized protein n=1 Tax=Cirrhinus molitorella TaxID=172907 RepID=A0ABR3NBK8_9TELE